MGVARCRGKRSSADRQREHRGCSCQLRADGVAVDQSRLTIPEGTSAAPVPLQGTASLTAPASFSVVCSIPGNGGFASDSKLSAIRVGEVTSSETEATGRAR